MNENRSAPCDGLMPHILYRNVANALAWLTEAFGFSEYYRYVGADGSVNNAQMYLGKAWIMLGSRSPSDLVAREGRPPQSLVVFVADVDSHFERARSSGALILAVPTDSAFGERQYEVEDLDCHQWYFSQHVRDVSPEEWGASLARA
jgi:uncharacterized glyoxalase superfamily protein PhnB